MSLLSFIFNYFKREVELKDIPGDFLHLIKSKVAFYHTLDEVQQNDFVCDVYGFTQRVNISGLGVDLALRDIVLTACSAIIPVFYLKDWDYKYLRHVYITPTYIPEDISGVRIGKASGLVRHSNLGFEVFLSRKSLYLGFENLQDKQNVGVHEFAHIIDGMDGEVDGFPKFLLSREDLILWGELKLKYIDLIKVGKTKINSYGATNSSEFFAVATEFFFENPFMIHKRYPDLYTFLVKIFNVDLINVYRRDMLLLLKEKNIGEKSDCPCKSGKKFKDCCMKY